jgi:hypothetical protein
MVRSNDYTRFNDEEIGFFQTSKHTRGFLEGKDPAFVLVALFSQFGAAYRRSLAFLPQPVALGIVIDPAHDGAHTVHRGFWLASTRWPPFGVSEMHPGFGPSAGTGIF